jgi:hypothetical protein
MLSGIFMLSGMSLAINAAIGKKNVEPMMRHSAAVMIIIADCEFASNPL